MYNYRSQASHMHCYPLCCQENEFIKMKSIILKLLVTSSFILCFSAAKSQKNENNAGELLYNGIHLPSQWPPKMGNPFSSEPMQVPYLKNPPVIIPIKIGRQLFIDDFLIDQTDLQRVYHKPVKYQGNPVLKDVSSRHGGVFYDPADQLFKIFFNDGAKGVGLATSKDLLKWNKTNTGPVMPPGGANAIWLDTEAANQNERFISMRAEEMKPRPKNDKNVPYINSSWQNVIQYSRDGMQWSEKMAIGRSNDYSSFFYNPFRKVWVLSLKYNVPRNKGEVYRTRYYEERKQLTQSNHVNDAVFWVNADKLDKPDPKIRDSAQLYSLHGVAYESILLGAFQVFLGPKNEISEEKKEPKHNEIKIGYSRDGFHWYRPDRESFIKGTYQSGDWDKAFINVPQGICLVMRDSLIFPYTGYSGISSDGIKGMYRGGSIGIASLRRDGFASMEAIHKKGTLLTKKLVFDGKYLFVNVDCPEGELRVEVLDENDHVILPYSFKNCKAVQADKTLYKISWQGAKDFSGLSGKPVKFRFHLTNGKLYSFWVSLHNNGASNGYLGASGRDI